MNNISESQRIAKFIARAGICSRRQAEAFITEGKVIIDGVIVTNPATKVTSSNNIMVNGVKISEISKTKLWIFHKPKGCITSNTDPEGRRTIFDLLPENMPRVITIGRLDYNSEGLLLLTNDGELARYMELPSSNLARCYKARAYGRIDNNKMKQIQNGVVIDKIKYAPVYIDIQSKKGDNFWINITIREGKNREVRKLLQYIGVTVNRLIRTEYGEYKLGKLPIGQIKEVKDIYKSRS